MREVRLRESDLLSDEEADAFGGKMLREGQGYSTLTGKEAVTVYKPDGSILLIHIPAAIPRSMAVEAWNNIRSAATPTMNRGTAAGEIDTQLGEIRHEGPNRARMLKKDGTLSNTLVARSVRSGVVGYYDRSARLPYCRMTSWSLKNPQKFQALVPYVAAVDSVFAEHAPREHAAQMMALSRASDDFYIKGTSFSTITVNKNWQTAVHKDSGDFHGGLGVMSGLCAGEYLGCYTVFPKFGVAADIRTGDVVLSDVHEWHGNTPFHGAKRGTFERITCVFYMREKIAECLSYEEELSRVTNRKAGDKI